MMIKRKVFYGVSIFWIATLYVLFNYSFTENDPSELLHVLGLMGFILSWITIHIYDRFNSGR